jgi:hypothetical protein
MVVLAQQSWIWVGRPIVSNVQGAVTRLLLLLKVGE